MRNYLTNHQMINCQSLAEALDWMSKANPAIPFAGGSDLMVLLNFKKLPVGTYINLASIPELRRPIQVSPTQIRLFALTTYMDVWQHPFFSNHFTLLKQAASAVGSIGIQTRGTWAGNIANASPAADGVPALMAYDAQVVLVSKNGQRVIPLENYYLGYKKTQKRPDELIQEIIIPIPTNIGMQYYRKVGERKAQAISKVLLAARIIWNADARIEGSRFIFGSVMPYTYRMYSLEKILQGKTISEEMIQECLSKVSQELKPIDDIRSTRKYRLQVAQNLLEEFLSQTLEKYRVSTAETRRIHI